MKQGCGFVLVGLGAVLLLSKLGIFWWLQWHYLWPAILIGFGLWIIFGGRRR